MKRLYSLIATILVTLLIASQAGAVFAAQERELTDDEQAAFIVRDEWTQWVKEFTASLSELDRIATAKIYEDMDFYDMQNRFTEKYKRVPEYLDEEGKPTQKLKDMIKEKRKEINKNKTSSGDSTEMINWVGTANADWMKKLPDNRYLNDINLPGLANCTMNYSTAVAQTKQNQCALMRQNTSMSISSALNYGYRAFDVGLMYTNSNAYLTNVTNNQNTNTSTVMNLSSGGGPTITDLLTYFKSFLNTHDKETIVLIIKNETQSEAEYRNLSDKLNTVFTSNDFKDYMYTGSSFPQLKDVRKKIVLISRFSENSVFNKGIYFGYNIQGMSGSTINGASLYAENHEYHYSATTKRNYVLTAFDTVTEKNINTNGTKGTNVALIYTGGYTYNSTAEANAILPSTVADTVNASIKAYDYEQGKLLGMVMMEFADSNMAPLIYKTNP